MAIFIIGGGIFAMPVRDMSKSSKKEAVIAMENMYKEKLLSRKYGLNRN